MSDKNNFTFKNMIEFFSGIAVFLGLIFVGLELRHNTEAVEAATFQSLTDASNSYILTIATNTETLRTYNEGHADLSSLTELDKARFFMLERAFWVRMQNVYSHWKRGTLSDQDWHLYNAVICDHRSVSKTTIATFKDHKHILIPEFSQLVEECWKR